MITASLLVSALIAGGSAVVGIITIAGGQVFLAIREIALNTREVPKKGTYRILEIFSYMIIIAGIFFIISGFIAGISAIIASFEAIR